MKVRIVNIAILTCLLATGQFDSQAFAQINLESSNITKVGHWPNGPCYATFVDGNFAYIGNGSAMDILDISDKTLPTRVGQIIINAIIYGLFVSEDYAYVTSGRGLHIVDVSKPISPQEVGFFSTNGKAYDVYISGHYAYVADWSGGFRIIDVSNPNSPRQTGFYNKKKSPRGVHVSGNYAYVTFSDSYPAGVSIIDITNPTSPNEVGFYQTHNHNPTDIYILDDFAYVTTTENPVGGLFIIDISTPSSPQRVGFLENQGQAYSVCVCENYAYISSENADVSILDISIPNAPSKTGFFKTDIEYDYSYRIYGDIFISDGYIYVAAGLGLRIFDVSAKDSPKQVGFYETGDRADKIFVSDHFAYVAAGFAGLHILDVSLPESPQRIGSCQLSGPAHDVYATGDYAYVTSGNMGVNSDGTKGIYIIDIRTPKDPHITGFYKTNNAALGLCVSKSIAYVAEYYGNLLLIDVSKPASPQPISTIPMRHAEDVDIVGNYCYVLDRSSSNVGLRMFDISNPHSPQNIGQIQCDGRRVYISGNYAYIVDSCVGVCSAQARLEIFSLGDQSFGQQVVSFDLEGDHPWDVFISDRYAYVATQYGLRLIDISTPALCQEVGYFETPPSFMYGDMAGGVCVSDNLIYLAAGESGLYILQNDLLTNVEDRAEQHPQIFHLLQNHPNPFNPTTSIEYELSISSYVRITISDICGRHIKTLVNQQQAAGRLQSSWDGTDERGVSVAGGLYFCRMQGGEYDKVVKMVLVK